MATRINVMKLLQEARGFAELTNRRPQTRSAALLLQAHWLSRGPAGLKRKRILRVRVENLPDIPHSVRITHITRPTAGEAAGD